MAFNYNYRILFRDNEVFSVQEIINSYRKYPGKKFLVEVKNTRGITSSQLKQLGYLKDFVKIRIAGGYDEEKIKHLRNIKYSKGETGDYYINAVIYDISEAIEILEVIEDIEKRIQPDWSDLEKVIYIYNKLKSLIIYDPKYETKLSKEIRSLRGLITKETVCAGFALIFKELMDRHNISCEYVQGTAISYRYEGDKRIEKRGGHAWNIVTINGKKYGIDLTWENGAFRAGKKNTFDFFGKEIHEFAKSHIPNTWEKTQNYDRTLSVFDEKTINIINNFLLREETYDKMKFIAKRNDGTIFILAQVGYAQLEKNTTIFRYYYQEIRPDGTKANPLILYSKSNLAIAVDKRNWGKQVPIDYFDTFKNILFSKTNIERSLRSGTLYIGCCKKNETQKEFEAVKHVNEISKPSEITKLFPNKSKSFRRSDGSLFVVEKVPSQNVIVNGQTILCFHIFEYLNEGKRFNIKRNIVFSERDFFNDNRMGIADDYLSRSRLDRKLNETGGYIGYYSRDGFRTYDPALVAYFKTPRYTGDSQGRERSSTGVRR